MGLPCLLMAPNRRRPPLEYSLGFSPISGKGGVEIAIHEMGHSAFGLADEYAYDSGNVYAGSEPGQPDITASNGMIPVIDSVLRPPER